MMKSTIMTISTRTDTSETEATARVVRWLCHDMASPIATLLTASELLGGDGDEEINALITAAIRRLSARLKLVRLSLGTVATMAAPALHKLLTEALNDTPLKLALSDASPPASIVGAAALILADLNRLAEITINDSGAHWASGAPLPPLIVEALSGQPGDDPRSHMVALAAAQAKLAGWRLAAEPSGISYSRS